MCHLYAAKPIDIALDVLATQLDSQICDHAGKEGGGEKGAVESEAVSTWMAGMGGALVGRFPC